MATMIPDDIEEFNTNGEKVFYHFLESVAKPDEQYLGWYAPEVNESEPDFVLYCREIGLVVFEVKDWQIEQIREVNSKKFVVDFGGKEISCTNPHQQAKGYLYNILDCLAKDGKLVSREGPNFGKPKVPISIGVVFPNINAMEYRDKFGESIIPLDKIFFWDDLTPYSDLNDSTGKRFAEILRNRFAPKFPCLLSGNELNHLRQLLYPSIRVQIVDRGPIPGQQDHDKTVRLLDHHQEVIARKFDGGHRIITGPSGSGKTLVLIHQAVFLQKYNPAIKRILFVCYNATLVNYIRRLLALQGAPLGPQGVEVLTFYELCAKLTGEDVIHENQDLSYYDLVIDLALVHEVRQSQLYDAILLDEGQDFSDRMLQVVMKCLNIKTNFLTVALDEGQEVYCTNRTWSRVGIHARGRIKKLGVVYRNTLEIAEFAAKFRGQKKPITESDKGQLRLLPDPRISRGPSPTLTRYKSLEMIIQFIVQQIRTMTDAGTYPFSDIAVIYTKKQPFSESVESLPLMLSTALDQHGILNKWLAEDYRAKRSHDITTNSVTITTIHSAKGLDYACVFLLGLDALAHEDRWTEEQINNLIYVGITRARYQLFLPYMQETTLIERIKSALKAEDRSQNF